MVYDSSEKSTYISTLVGLYIHLPDNANRCQESLFLMHTKRDSQHGSKSQTPQTTH